MKVNRVLNDDEVKDINDQAGVSDLPRLGKAGGGAVDDQPEPQSYAHENDLLQPINQSRMIGDEKSLFDEGVYKAGVSGFSMNNRKSIRYLHHDENDNPIGALQIMTEGPRSKKAVIQNVYVAEPFRRSKIATGLLKRARQDYDVRHSNDLTNAGRSFAKAVKKDGGAVDDEDEGLTAYHGSPHDFPKFDVSKIGTGEGAQAYGHGLYFAESEPVAKEYRDRLTDKTTNFRVGDIDMPKWILRSIENADDKNAAIEKHRQDFSSRIAEAEAEKETSHQPWMVSGRISTAKDILAGLDQLQQGAPAPHTKGRMYEVRINAHPDHFVDYNAPLSEQSDYIKDALRKRYGDVGFQKLIDRNEDGEYIARRVENQEHLNEMNRLGIKGIKYFDAGSRDGAGQPTRNYVVFNHDHVQVKRKYAEGGAVDDEDDGITAYHGSPHDFEKFDTSKIGTGEGAQAYGHGLYFAENEDVARGYRDSLSANQPVPLEVDGERFEQPTRMQKQVEHHFGDVDAVLGRMAPNWDRAISAHASMPHDANELERMIAEGNAEEAHRERAEVEGMRDKTVRYGKPGHMYEVRINAHPDHFLDWDAPVYEQPQFIQDAVKKSLDYAKENAANGPSALSGMFVNSERSAIQAHSDTYLEHDGAVIQNMLERVLGAQGTSDALAQHGVKGIKYFDVGSRGQGGSPNAIRHNLEKSKAKLAEWQEVDHPTALEQRAMYQRDIDMHERNLQKALANPPTRNYVVFDQNHVQVKRKYAQGGAIAGAEFVL
jgi:hypothetical protein